jgi:hypothetical protein
MVNNKKPESTPSKLQKTANLTDMFMKPLAGPILKEICEWVLA